MATPVTNFGKATVSTTYDAAATSIVLSPGHGSRLPSTFPYPLTWWNATDYSDPADDPNREIVTVTNRATDTLTVTRGAESSGASTKNTAGKTYKMVLGLTKAMWDSIFNLSLSQDFRGLQLQTHPDSDKLLSQVRLVHADAIVMDDGEEIADWNDLDASITASGIGGLDTGSEQANTWYQIIASYNGTTKGIYLHRAKDYFLDTSYTAGEDASQGLRSAVDNSTVRINQGLQFATAGPFVMYDIKLIKTGTPTGNYWIELYSNSGGVPGTLLATSRKYDASRVTTTATVIRMVFDTPFSVSAATQYHVVLQGDYTVSASNFLSWRMDGSAGAYANGSKALYDSDTATWTADADDDMWFKAYVTRNDTALTKPTGYTQSAVIGWVYNDASSDFKHFRANDRTVFCGYDDDWNVGSFTTALNGLVHLAEFIPPVSVVVQITMYDGAVNFAIGGLSVTDLTATNIDERIGAVRFATAGANLVATSGDLSLSEYQGMMYFQSAGTVSMYAQLFRW